MMQFRVLGPLEVLTERGPAALGGMRPRALLAILLLRSNAYVPRERLIDLLWDERPPESALGALQVHVHALRKALGKQRLLTRDSGYRVVVEPGELDLERFIELSETGRSLLASGNADAASRALADALGLWRGPPLADLAHLSFRDREAFRLEELRLGAVEDRIEADLRLGRHDEVIAELRSLVAEHPYRERLYRHLMLALYRAGRQAAALDAYAALRSVLVEELGLEPAAESRALQGAILKHDPSLSVEPFELRSRRHLPAPATELIGRRAEIDEVVSLLETPAIRLLTLTGPGGIGKTRVALGAAFDLARAFVDGVYFVGLAGGTDPRRVASLVAQSIGVAENPERPVSETLADALSRRRLLLLLDNFEHLLDAAPLVGDLLRAAPELKVLVTSREPLRVYGEHLFPVPPMSRDEAVPLFFARARAVAPSLDPNEEAHEAVASICAALDNLPLAIELAAARSDELAPPRMAEHLGRRLELASAGPRDLEARQRTLRAAIDWSYGLLSARHAEVFRELAVFAGAFSAAAAERVCGAESGELEGLADRSLLRRTRGPRGELRFSLLATIKEFAFEQLTATGRSPALRREHARFYADVAETGDDVSRAPGPQRQRQLERLEADMDDIVAALEWGLEEERADDARYRVEVALRIAGSMAWVWWILGRAREARAWVDRALDRSRSFPSESRARCLHAVGILADVSGDLDRAERSLSEAVEAFTAMGDRRKLSAAMNSLAIITRSRGDLPRARELLQRSMELRQELGDERGVTLCLGNLGVFALDEGDLDRAEEMLERARVFNRRNNDRLAEAGDDSNLAAVALEKGDPERAGALLRAALPVLLELGDLEGVAEGLGRVASVAAASAQSQRAALLFGASDALMAAVGKGLAEVELQRVERYRQMARGSLGEEAFETWAAKGRTLDFDGAVAEALAPTLVVTEPPDPSTASPEP